MTEQIVVFKGTRDGLYLIINEGYALKVIKEKIQEKITSAQSFFQGIENIKIKGTSLSQKDLCQLADWMKETYEIEIKKSENVEKIEKEENGLLEEQEIISQLPIEKGLTKFIYTTLRSGRKEQFDGNIVIIGDVNPGAEIVATGNIIVMGILRGIAHAGASGNKYATVVGFSLQPTQLRIADIITRAPDQQTFKPTCPEKAYINGDEIIILPYYKNM